MTKQANSPPTSDKGTSVAPPPPPGWRLTLPKVLLDILVISRTESQVVMTMSKGYIEVWTTDVWNEALSAPLDQIVDEG